MSQLFSRSIPLANLTAFCYYWFRHFDKINNRGLDSKGLLEKIDTTKPIDGVCLELMIVLVQCSATPGRGKKLLAEKRVHSMDFEQVFRYRFSKNWALRNILVNYFVYWRGGERDPGVDVKKLHEFIKANGVFKGEQYPGIGRMLMIEDIFEEKTSIMDGTDYQYPGLIPEEHIQLFEKVVNDEYGLDQVLIKKPASYTVAKFMWNVYHNQNQFGRPGRKISSDHMLEIASQLFLDRFPRGLKVSEESSIRGKYLLVETDHYKWPLFFISGSRLINDEVEVFRVARAYKVSDPDSEFPTICGTYFGDKIKEFARESGIQLLQISSLFKFFRWVDSKKREGVDPEKIAPHLDLIPDQPEVPIPVGLAIQKIQKQI